MKNIYYFILLLLAFFSNYNILAKDFVIKGQILSSQQTPIEFVSIIVVNNNTITYSDAKGYFSIESKVLPITIELSMLGYRTKEFIIKEEHLGSFILEEESLTLPNITVTAKLRKSIHGSSSYSISHEAIKQIQAMSLGDILSSIPGGKISAPNMTRVQQFSHRTANPSSIDAFASAIIVDGVMNSNDANLQAYNPAAGIFGGKSAVGKGIDLRTITPESIESVEVITGVPSARYGNIASGAVLIKRKVAPQKLTTNISLNATNYQLGVSQGVKLAKGNLINYSLTGTYAKLSPTQQKDYYQSFSGEFNWQTFLSKKLDWHHTLSLSGSYAFNGKDFEDEDVLKNIEEYTHKHLSIANRGHLNILGKLNYTFAINLKKQYSILNTTETNGPIPLIEGIETGTYKSSYSGFSYKLNKEIIGLPLNIQAKIDASSAYKFKKINIHSSYGLQFSYDKNFGKGRIGGKSIVGDRGAIGSRNAKFHELPALRIFSAFYEARMTHTVKESTSLSLTSGIRYENINSDYHLLSPRITGNFRLNKSINLKSAWGISYKAPALIHLYPGPTYIDFTNMSFFSNNKEERMAVVTTHKIEQTNKQLKPIKGNLFELGAEFNLQQGNLQLTYFDKTIQNGIASSPEIIILQRQKYKVVKRYNDRMPDIALIPNAIDNIMLTHYRMKNDINSKTQGVEVLFSSEKIKATHTSFDLQLSFLKTTRTNAAYRMTASQFTIGDDLPRIGVYENPVRKNYTGVGSITAIQHLPALSLIFTLRTELNFYNFYKYLAAPIYPIGYYTQDNKYVEIPKSNRKEEHYSDLFLAKGEYAQSNKPPFYPNFHLQVRKELKNGSSLQFYAHNFMWYTPTYEEKGKRWILNSDIYFGLGLTINL